MSVGKAAAPRTLNQIGFEDREIMLIENLISSTPQLQQSFTLHQERIARPDILLVNGDDSEALSTWKNLYNGAPQSNVLFISSSSRDFAPHQVLRRPLTLRALVEKLESLTDKRQQRDTGSARELEILIVDDSLQAREFLQLKLAEVAPDGFALKVDHADRASEGIAKCLHGSYDLIFLDVEMPGMDGFQACEKIRAISNARIAMLTSKSMAEDFRKGTGAGCNHYLIKPPHDSDLRVIMSLTSMKKY